MSYKCIYCDFTAPTNTRLKRHLATQKHATNFEKHQLENNTDQIKLCENIDCERYPPDWDFEEDTHENYEDGRQWVKCNLCDGYLMMMDQEIFYLLKKNQIIKLLNVIFVEKIMI